VHANLGGRVLEMPWSPDEVRAGDLVGFRRGGGVNHLATCIAKGDVIHAIKPLGVQCAHLSALPFLARQYRMIPAVIYRPLQTL
jgi:cell wall-associated NlpC family hydrolase